MFLDLVERYGPPASTLTDNGRVYTARFGGGRNAFEYLLPLLGVRQKNGSPGHPQTQGKVERFHQTLQRWLKVACSPAALTVQAAWVCRSPRASSQVWATSAGVR